MIAFISVISRIIIGIIFIISGLAKISDPVRMIFTLREFRLFPDFVIPFVAIYMPWLELVIGLCIFLGLMHRTAAVMLMGLIGLFTLAIASVIVRGIEVDCGCFGMLADMLHLPDMADWKALIRNIILTILCLPVVNSHKSPFSLENYLGRIHRKK